MIRKLSRDSSEERVYFTVKDGNQVVRPVVMLDLFIIVLPVFGLVALSYAAGRLGLIGDAAVDGFAQVIFVLALPALMFKLVTGAQFPDSLPWGYWIAYYVGMGITWALTMVVTRSVFGGTHGDAVIAGLAAGQANTVLIGIPIIIKTYGEAAAFPIAMLVAVNLPITMTAATLLLESGRASGGETARKLALSLAGHPILIGLAAGLAVQVSGVRLPASAVAIVDLLAAMALPGGLVALGLSLRRYGIRDTIGIAVAVSTLKLVLHPAIAFVLAHHVFALPPAWTGTVVLFAAMPAGINAYLFAMRYGQGEGLASSAVALSTLLSVGTTVFWLWVLGAG